MPRIFSDTGDSSGKTLITLKLCQCAETAKTLCMRTTHRSIQHGLLAGPLVILPSSPSCIFLGEVVEQVQVLKSHGKNKKN